MVLRGNGVGIRKRIGNKGIILRKMQRLMKEAGIYCETTKPSVRPSPLYPTEER